MWGSEAELLYSHLKTVLLGFESHLRNSVALPLTYPHYLQFKFKARLNACIVWLNFQIDLGQRGAKVFLDLPNSTIGILLLTPGPLHRRDC